MTETALLYLFSTIAQTYGAILGVMGMLAVYRLQVLREVRRGRIERLRNPLGHFFSAASASWNSDTIIKKWKERFPKGSHGLISLGLIYYEIGNPEVLQIEKNVNSAKQIKNSAYWLFGVHLPIIVLSLIALTLVDFLKRSSRWGILVAVLVVVCISCWQIVQFVRSILSHE
jgi:hypothetical protein